MTRKEAQDKRKQFLLVLVLHYLAAGKDTHLMDFTHLRKLYLADHCGDVTYMNRDVLDEYLYRLEHFFIPRIDHTVEIWDDIAHFKKDTYKVNVKSEGNHQESNLIKGLQEMNKKFKTQKEQ